MLFRRGFFLTFQTKQGTKDLEAFARSPLRITERLIDLLGLKKTCQVQRNTVVAMQEKGERGRWERERRRGERKDSAPFSLLSM
jgi:hypothetical protein